MSGFLLIAGLLAALLLLDAAATAWGADSRRGHPDDRRP